MAPNTGIVTVGQAYETILPLAEKNWEKGIMLWGPTGIGKTSICEKIARVLADKYFKETGIDISGRNFHHIPLPTIEPVDLRGLPYFDHAKKQSVFYPPSMLPTETHPGVILLDEITAADPRIYPTAYSLLQERRIGSSYCVPDNYIVIATGNGAEHGAISHEMGTALADRFIHFRVEAGQDDWLNYMMNNGGHPLVCTHIKKHGDHLERSAERVKDGNLIDASPRGWESVSDLLRIFDPYKEADRVHLERTIPGILGEYVSALFFEEIDQLKDSIDARTLFKANDDELKQLMPKTIGGLYSLCFAIPPLVKDKDSALRAFDIYYAMRHLETDDQCPVMEISTWGMDKFFSTCVDDKILKPLLNYAPYQKYRAERREHGLE